MADNMVIRLLRGNLLLFITLLLLIVLYLFTPSSWREYPSFVDWETIITLSGLLLVTGGIKDSGFFYRLARSIILKIHNERTLAILLIFTSAILSMILTNDIALFIVVPLTLGLQKITGNDFLKIIIFEAIAVNVGSTLTPIGNPQNIFLWHQWEISFPAFVWKMLPLVMTLSALLLIFAFIFFQKRPISNTNHQHIEVDKKLFTRSVVLFVLFLMTVELGCAAYFLPVIIVFYGRRYKKVIFNSDWGLILLFIIIFIDLHLISEIQFVKQLFHSLKLENSSALFFTGIFTSQAISNVPAAILLAKYSVNWHIIAYAVNVGSNGLIVGSFANMIALRFVNRRAKLARFHGYSLLFLFVSLVVTYFLFVC